MAPRERLSRVGAAGVPGTGVAVRVDVGVAEGGTIGEGDAVGAARCVATTMVAMSSGEVLGTCMPLHDGAIASKHTANKVRLLVWICESS